MTVHDPRGPRAAESTTWRLFSAGTVVTCNQLVTRRKERQEMQDTQNTLQALATSVGPAVVGLGRGWGVGSGVVVEGGRVVTNAHNLRGDEATVTFADGRRETATVAGADPDGDLAVLLVDTGDVEPVAWAQDGAAPGIGTAVVALANPGGRGLRVTHGFVSSE